MFLKTAPAVFTFSSLSNTGSLILLSRSRSLITHIHFSEEIWSCETAATSSRGWPNTWPICTCHSQFGCAEEVVVLPREGCILEHLACEWVKRRCTAVDNVKACARWCRLHHLSITTRSSRHLEWEQWLKEWLLGANGTWAWGAASLTQKCKLPYIPTRRLPKKKKHVFWCKHCQSRTGVVLILLLASQGKEAEVQAGD